MNKLTYSDIIGIKAEYKNTTRVGKNVYNVHFCTADGTIEGPFAVFGYLLDCWKIRRGQNCGRYTITTHTTPTGREIIDTINPNT